MPRSRPSSARRPWATRCWRRGRAWSSPAATPRNRDRALALATLRRGLDGLERSAFRDPAVHLELLARLGALLCRTGRLEEGLGLLAAAAAAERAAGSRARAEVYGRLGHWYDMRGDTDVARYYQLRAIATYEQAAAQDALDSAWRLLAGSNAAPG